jgi:hypothetical protein
MSAKQYVGTLIGPEGQRVGQYVDWGDHHNEVQRLRLEVEQLRQRLNPPEPGADLKLINVLHVWVDNQGNVTFCPADGCKNTQVRFDLGQRLVVARGEDGLLVLSFERPTDKTSTDRSLRFCEKHRALHSQTHCPVCVRQAMCPHPPEKQDEGYCTVCSARMPERPRGEPSSGGEPE